MTRYQAEIERIEKAFDDGDLDLVRELLPPLLEAGVPAAIRIHASFCAAEVPAEERERRYVRGIFAAAELGDVEARYRVGVFYDLGACGIERDRQKAAEIFKTLADEGDPHCMWIYASQMIWDSEVQPRNLNQGIRLLFEAAERGSAKACMAIAEFYDGGIFGFSKDRGQRDQYRRRAQVLDDTTYDPYSEQPN